MTSLFKCVFTLALLLFFSISSFAQVDVGFDGGEGVVLRERAHPARYTFFFEQFDELELGPNEEFIKLVVQPKNIKFYGNPELKGEPIATIDKDAIKLDGKVVYPSHKVTWDCKGCYYRYFYGSSYQGREAEVPYLYIRQGDITGGFVQYIYADEFNNGVAKVTKFNKFNSIDEVVDIPLKRDFYFRPSDVSKFYYIPSGQMLRDRFLSKYPVISGMYQSLKKCAINKDLACIKKRCNLNILDDPSFRYSRLNGSSLPVKILELFHVENSEPIKYNFYETEKASVKTQKMTARIVSLRETSVEIVIYNRADVKGCSLYFGDDYKLPKSKRDDE